MKMGDGATHTSAYDENGNIKAMWQKGLVINGPQVIDNMTYSYASLSNKLLNVSDGAMPYKLGDFTDGNNFSDDYSYDVNGNLVTDLNKDIYGSGFGVQPGIEYNHLNLPQHINLTGNSAYGREIYYTYDAAGNKLEKIVQESTGRGHSAETITRYIAGLVYESKVINGDPDDPASYTDVLQFAGQEEGRIRFKPATNTSTADFAYDYFIKDHLGNVRMVLTEEAQADQYPAATMEDATATAEETYYSNLNTTRVAPPSGYPANTPSGNAKVARVSGGTNLADHKIVPAILLKVMSGDKFNVSVNSWWKKDAGTPVNSPNSAGAGLLEALINGVGGLGGSKFTPSQLTTAGAFVTGISTFLTPQPSSTGTSGKPKAFLNWILFDEQFNYVSSNSGFEAVGGNDVYTAHTQSNLPVTKNGFLYIYTSNETPNVDVFFDNLQVTHTRGQMLEETHYYPFGLTMAGISSKAAGSMLKRFGFNGIEFNTDLDINTYEAFYRTLDPQIGRFWQIDPKLENAETWSPYAAMLNNPIRYADPLGDSVGVEDNSYFDRKTNTVVQQLNITVTGKVVNESTTPYTAGQMQTIADRISQSIISTYSDVSENSTTTVTTDITVASASNPEVKSDHLFILRDKGDLPDPTAPGRLITSPGAVGVAMPGEKGVYMTTSLVAGVPATTGPFAGTGKTVSGGGTIERTASHELGHSLYQYGGSAGFVGHPATGTDPGNIMNQTGQTDAGMKLTLAQRFQILQDFNAGKFNGGRQRY